MIIQKEPYWNNLVSHYYDYVHWEDGAPKNIYDWLEKEYKIVSNTGSKVLDFKDNTRLTFFVLRFGS